LISPGENAQIRETTVRSHMPPIPVIATGEASRKTGGVVVATSVSEWIGSYERERVDLGLTLRPIHSLTLGAILKLETR
jgi:hypothetical protein